MPRMLRLKSKSLLNVARRSASFLVAWDHRADHCRGGQLHSCSMTQGCSYVFVLLCAGEQGREGDAEEAEGQGVHHSQVQHQDAEECQALELMWGITAILGLWHVSAIDC